MLRLPMHPRYSRMLVEAARHGCVPAAGLCAATFSKPRRTASIVAGLSVMMSDMGSARSATARSIAARASRLGTEASTVLTSTCSSDAASPIRAFRQA